MGFVLPEKSTLGNYSFSPTLTSIIRFDTSTVAGSISSQVVLSEAGQIHLSKDSVYLTSNMWTQNNTSTCPAGARCAMPIWNGGGSSSTFVHRFAFEGIKTNYVYSALVSGSPLTQYSMDEYKDKNFRIVTSESGEKRSTRVSVLNSRGKLVGSLADIAPGETFQSSRFIGNRLYLVTFEQIDPFFVIDFTAKQTPKIL